MAKGIQLEKPKNNIQENKFNNDLDKIKELLNLGLSVRKIAIFLGYSNHISLKLMWLIVICEKMLNKRSAIYKLLENFQ